MMKSLLCLLLAASFLILIGRSIRAGVPIGFTDPRRDERPFQFWLVMTFMLLPAMWLTSEAWSKLR
ncbi:hypothetical protein [Sphingopyxis sp. GC21]|uniref:hypothetical protein n=1 Tax=Sphingopyxis sp. GC21 TaxID=2933562 RepID=UPI0021E3B732|nr:hypothetical protein [Sphingopyxis sp. GC21]